MTIKFKTMGDTSFTLAKDSAGNVWISLGNGESLQTMPLSNTDIRNLIETLDFLRNQRPANLETDAFSSNGTEVRSIITAEYPYPSTSGGLLSDASTQSRVYVSSSSITNNE